MTTLEEAIRNKRLWAALVQRYPGLNHDSMPSIDAMVVEFLRRHDVFVTPVGSNINSSPGMNAMMGAVGGPMAVGVNQALTAQVKGAALQEWTSWKQWTLSHADWPEFKTKMTHEYRGEIDRATHLIGDTEVQDFIANFLQKDANSGNNVCVIVGVSFAALVLLSAILSTIAPPSPSPSSIQKSTENKPYSVSEAAEACRQKVIASGAGSEHQYFVGVKADTERFANLIFQRPDGYKWEASYPCE